MKQFKCVFIRHGQSELNHLNVFGGWIDAKLSLKGYEEASQAAKLLQQNGYQFDVVHTSALQRTIQTSNCMLEVMNSLWVPTHHTWRLNERHYGVLQGMNKKDAAKQYGEQQVKLWRRSYSQKPPAQTINTYVNTESLEDVVNRVKPYWIDHIANDILLGKQVLVIGHSNSIRSILQLLKRMNEQELLELNIPTAVPLVIQFNHDLSYSNQHYLGDQDIINKKVKDVANQGKIHYSNQD